MQLLKAIKEGQNRWRLLNLLRIKQGEKQISDFDKRRISQPKNQ